MKINEKIAVPIIILCILCRMACIVLITTAAMSLDLWVYDWELYAILLGAVSLYMCGALTAKASCDIGNSIKESEGEDYYEE